VFDALAKQAVDRQMQVVESRTVLNILKQKRLLDAWREQLPQIPAKTRSVSGLGEEEEKEFTLLALDFYRFRVLSQSISSWRSTVKKPKAIHLTATGSKEKEPSNNLGTPRSSTGSSLQKNIFKHYS
jgi:hypothetical protein